MYFCKGGGTTLPKPSPHFVTSRGLIVKCPGGKPDRRAQISGSGSLLSAPGLKCASMLGALIGLKSSRVEVWVARGDACTAYELDRTVPNLRRHRPTLY